MSERWNEMDDIDLLQLEAEMQDDLCAVREAATVYAERAWARGGHTTATARPGVRQSWLRWAAAGVAAAAMVVGGVRLAHHPGVNTPDRAADAPVVKVQPASPVSDEALLEQIQSDLASGVPTAMEPLQASDAQSARNAVRR